VAGCSFATTLLKLSVMGTMDDVQEAFPTAKLAVVVDDITVAAVGKTAEVEATVKGAISMLTHQLEDVCHLKVSDSKTALLANVPGLAESIAAGSQRLTDADRYSTKNLGVDFAAGKPLRAKVRAERLKNSARGSTGPGSCA
jgi:hypothetical protein